MKLKAENVNETKGRKHKRLKTSKKSNVGNNPQLRFGSALASLFFFFLPLLSFFFVFKLPPPPKPFPCMAIYRKSHLGQVKLAQARWLLHPEGISSPGRASYLGLKEFHGLGEPNASLGELWPEISRKWPFRPFPCGFCSWIRQSI